MSILSTHTTARPGLKTLASALVLVSALTACSQGAKPDAAASAAAPATPPFATELGIAEIMEGVVMPMADAIWMSTQIDVTADGEKASGPTTDEAWLTLRHQAVTLAVATNLLMIPQIPISKNPDSTDHAEGSLSPAEMTKLRNANLPAFAAHAKNLHDLAMKAIEAIDKRDSDAISNVGGDMDAVCEACHKQFWYPNG